jgi:alpha-tubulin suppressor-like RCC1 family protein/uncharacterized protein YjdB
MPRLRFAASAAALFLIAACGGDSTTSPSNNPPPPSSAAINSIDLSPATVDVVIGRTKALTATPRDANGRALTGRTLTWTTSAATVATVDANGGVTGIAPGTATISVAAEGKTATAAVTVKAPTVAAVVVGPASPTVKLGETIALAATIRDDAGVDLPDRRATWASSAPSIASVDAATGVVTGMAGGSATITATSDGVSGSVAVTVNVPVATVTVTPALDTLEAYDPKAMAAILRDAKNNVLTNRVVRWASSNPAIAAIDSVTGVLTGLDRGTVTITATSETKTGSASRVIVIKYRQLAAGSMHACDIASGGFVWCWGLNGREGRIGSATLGDNAMSAVPVLVPNTGPTALRFAQLSSYGTHTCGVTIDSRGYCWGNNSWGQLGGNSNASQSNVPVAVSSTLQFRQISAGADHSCGVTTDNRAYCWGHNDSRQFASTAPAMSTTPVAVAPELSFASVTAGTSFTCGVTTSGAGYCWGYSGLGQLGDGARISYGNTYSATPVAVATTAGLRGIDASLSFACAVTTGNQGLCWGSNGGRLGNGNSSDSSLPQPVSGGLSFSAISSGNGFSCGVTTDAAVWCWGSNDNGQLGVAGPAVATSPVRAAGSLLVSEVSTAAVSTGFGRHSCIIAQDRLTTYCFGRNEAGQLGNGTTTTPTAVNSTPTIVVGQKPLP